MSATRWGLLVMAAVAAVPGVAAAQEPGGAAQMARDTVTLTLDRALSLGLGSNPAYRRALNSAQLNGTEMRTTWFDQVLPQAQLDLFSTRYTGNLTRIATDNFGNPIENPTSDWNYFSATTQSLNLTWVVQGASIFDALDRQKLTNLDRDVAETRARTTMGVGVRRAFMDALEQRDLLRAEEELLEGRRLDQDAAERLFGLAMRTRVDVLNAELAVEQQALAVRQQEAALERAKLTLRTQLGDDQLGPFRLAETPLPVFDPSALDAEALVRQALDVNPELRQSRVGVQSAEVGVREANRSWWPQLIFNFEISRRAQTPETEALFDVSFDEDLDQRFYIGLQIPMFNDYFSNTQAIHRAKVEAQNSRETERETTLRVEESVRAALLELGNQHESLRVAERSAQIAGEALRLAREEYRLGTRTFEDLRQSIDQEATTRRQVITARHSFVDALLSLEEAVGEPVRPGSGGPGGGR